MSSFTCSARISLLVAALAIAPAQANGQTCALDRNQSASDYGYWFEQTVERWQTFTSGAPTLCRLDLYIQRNGSPGNVHVEVRDAVGELLWEELIPQGAIPAGLNWNAVAIDPPVPVTPGAVYKILVRSDAASPDPDNRYFWAGQTASSFEGTSDVSDVLPGYAYAVRTWGESAGGPAAIITTCAGGGAGGLGDGGPATAATLGSPYGVAVNTAGDLFIADPADNRVRKVAVGNGVITTVAGTGIGGFSGDGGPATAAQLDGPVGLAVDTAGNIYVAEYFSCRIRKITSATGLIETVAGTGTCAFNGDGSPGIATWLYNPTSVAVDAAGNLYVADMGNSRIRRVSASTGVVTTVAGTGGFGFSGDGGPATAAGLNAPWGAAVDAAGNIFIADTENSRVRKVTAASGIITTIAGTGTPGFSGDGGPATAAQLEYPYNVKVDNAGNIFIADPSASRVRMIAAPTGLISTVAGTGGFGFSGDGGPATAADFDGSVDVAVDSAGILYVADVFNGRIRKVGPAPPPPPGDFTGDLKSDLLWRHATGGDVWLWPMDGAARIAESYMRTVADTNWEIRGQGDQDGDGDPDLLWRNKVSGEIYFWPMVGATPEGEVYVGTVDPAYDIVGTGDFDGDGKTDLLWRHMTLGDVWIWLMDGATPAAEVYVDRVDPGYVVKGVGRFDANAQADIVWHHAATGDVWIWLMDGATKLSETWVATVPDTGYQIQALGDFTGDGKADLVWWHATRGEVWIWTMNGAARLAETYVATVPDPGYRIAGAGDYDGDGTADLLWHHATNGEVWVWLMDGTAKLSETWVATVPDTGYQIVK